MNWIPINTTLPTSPKIVILASLLKCKRREAFGLAVEFFCWLDANFFNGHTHMTAKQLNQLFDKKGFAEAMCEIGWGQIDENGHYVVQDFDAYNSKATKRRLKDVEKKRNQRAKSPHDEGTNGDFCPHDEGTKWGLHNITVYNNGSVSSDEYTEPDPPKQSKVPLPETADAVLTYIASLPSCGLVGQELTTCAQTFFDRSEAVGWTINGQPIRDWRAAARAYLAKWQGNNASRQAATTSPTMNKPKITYRSQTQQNYELR